MRELFYIVRNVNDEALLETVKAAGGDALSTAELTPDFIARVQAYNNALIAHAKDLDDARKAGKPAEMVPPVLIDELAAQVNSAVLVGIQKPQAGDLLVKVHVEDDAPVPTMEALDTVVKTHDPAVLTAKQTERAAKEAERAAALAIDPDTATVKQLAAMVKVLLAERGG